MSVQETIETKLASLEPLHLDVVNELSLIHI